MGLADTRWKPLKNLGHVIFRSSFIGMLYMLFGLDWPADREKKIYRRRKATDGQTPGSWVYS